MDEAGDPVGRASATALMTIPPRLCPTSTTGSAAASTRATI